jgi:hypothetical protein
MQAHKLVPTKNGVGNLHYGSEEGEEIRYVSPSGARYVIRWPQPDDLKGIRRWNTTLAKALIQGMQTGRVSALDGFILPNGKPFIVQRYVPLP